MGRRWFWCDRAERALLQMMAVLLASMLLSVTAQVLSRMVGVAFLVWTDEVIRIAVVWVTFLGSAVAIRRNAHFVIDLFVRALPPGAARVAERSICGAVTVVVLILVWTGWQLSEIALDRVYPITRIRQAWAFAAVPIGGVLMLLFLVEQILAPPPKRSMQAGGETA